MSVLSAFNENRTRRVVGRNLKPLWIRNIISDKSKSMIKYILIFLLFFFHFCSYVISGTKADTYDISAGQVMKLVLSDQISFLAWSPDSSKLAVSSRNDTVITLWDLNTKSLIWKINKLLGVNVEGKDLEFGPGGDTIITGSAISIDTINSDVSISIISVKSGKIIKNIKDDNHGKEPVRIWNLITSLDRSKLFVAMGDYGRIGVYDTSTWQKINEIGPIISQYRLLGGAGRPGGIRRLAFDDRHNLLFISVADGHIQTWDVFKNSQHLDFQPFKIKIKDIILNDITGELIVGASGDIHGYPKSLLPSGNKSSNTFFSLQDDPETLVQAWNPIIGKELRSYRGPGDTAVAVAVSPNGVTVAAAKARSLIEKVPSYVLMWDAKSGELLSKIDCGQSMLGGLAFSPDNKFLAYSTDNVVHIIALKKN